MEPPLLYEYAYDWRVRAALWRMHVSTKEFVNLSRSAQVRELFWLAFFLFAGVLALQARSWVFLVLVLGFAVWRAFRFFTYVTTVRQAMFALRASFRQPAKKGISLKVNEMGLLELDGGVESFAPWETVKAFFLNEKLIAIELVNNQWACIPRSTLNSSSSSIELLVRMLEARAVPRIEGPPNLLLR